MEHIAAPRPMLFRDVCVGGRHLDVRVGREVLALGHGIGVEGDLVIAGQGRLLCPGLHDHHCHLRASLAARASLNCSPRATPDARMFIAAMLSAPGEGWLRVVGYHDSIAGEIDRWWLDAHGPDRPVRVQHRTGRLWVLNSKACDLLADPPPDGRLLDGDTRVRAALGDAQHDAAELLEELLSWGITGVTDTTPTNEDADAEALARLFAPLDLFCMGGERRTRAPLKIHDHDGDLPALSDRMDVIRNAHSEGRAVAIHAATLAELMLAVAGFEEAGTIAGDRIEHGAVVPENALPLLRALRLPVVTQPLFPEVRAEAYARDVDPRDQRDLWRVRSLLDAGITVAAGSDAPLESANPWAAIAALGRRSDEGVGFDAALDLYLRDPRDLARVRQVVVGAPADLCLVGAGGAALTLIGGAVVHSVMASIKPQRSASAARSL